MKWSKTWKHFLAQLKLMWWGRHTEGLYSSPFRSLHLQISQWDTSSSGVLKFLQCGNFWGGLTIVPTAAQKCVAFTLWSLAKQKEMNRP